MSFAEFIEWIAYYRADSGEAPSAEPKWKKMMQSLKLVSELQKVRS